MRAEMKLRVQVLFMLLAASLDAAFKNASASAAFMRLGCFIDKAPRASHVLFHNTGKQSPTYCANQCKDFRYFGLQAGAYCMCSSNRKGYMTNRQVEDSECSMKCPGDPRFTCGNHWINEVYLQYEFTRLGCFTDKAERALQELHDHTGKESPVYCADKCRYFKFFGLQAGGHCTCGSDGYMKYGRVNDSECSMKCSGDPRFTCGNHWINEVYLNYELNRIGCFVDKAERALPVTLGPTGKASPLYCALQCRRYVYFGLQAGRYCTCGNHSYMIYGKVKDSECSMKCSGDPRFTCGNHMINEVYLNHVKF